MGNYEFTVSIFSLIVTVILRSIAGIYYFLVVKKSAQEVAVHNGLIRLRRQLFAMSVILFLVNTLSMGLIMIHPFITQAAYQGITDFLAIFNSFGFLFVAIFLYSIYTQQYTSDLKSAHERIEQLEGQVEDLQQ